MLGIFKSNKHSFRDFGLTIKSKEIGVPKKKKIKETIPFMNGSYDFSNLYGGPNYEERTLSYTFNLQARNKVELNSKKIYIINWLMDNSSKEPLFDDTIPGYYFLAECEDISTKENGNYIELSVKFTTYPFKISDSYEGNNFWDTFNFENDVLQDRSFIVNGTSTINLYNSSAIEIDPIIVTSNNFELIKDGKSYIVQSGESKDYRFKLKKGNNKITIKGTGTIEFRFRKEVL